MIVARGQDAVIAIDNEDDGEVTEEAARIFFLVPETYATVCANALKKQKKSEK